MTMVVSGVARILVRGEHFRGVAAWGVRGAEPPDAGEYSKIFTKVLRGIAKNLLF